MVNGSGRVFIERSGELIISGGTGTGKTTLLNALAGFIEPNDGQPAVCSRQILLECRGGCQSEVMESARAETPSQIAFRR